MTNEQMLLLELMKKAIKGQHLQALPQQPVDWLRLWQEACDQTVPILAYEVLSPVQEQLFQQAPALAEAMLCALTELGHNAQVEQSQAELVKALEKLLCPYVILKGNASARYYPDPALRTLGDVDVLIPWGQVSQVAREMSRYGYVLLDKYAPHHKTLRKGALVIELHRELGGIPGGTDREAVERYLEDIYTQAKPLQTQSGTCMVAAEKHHALNLVLHMLYHVEEYGFGLRHLMDWACFVDRTADKPFWDGLLVLLRQIGLLRFTAVMTKMSAVYFDSFCPAWAEAVEEDLCRDMMQDILSGGNFGRKDQDRARSATMLPDWSSGSREGKIKRMYKDLRKYILLEKPELEHRPVILAVHMLYRTVRFAVLYVQGKRPNLVRAAAIAEQRKSVYERLCLHQKSREQEE